MPSKPSKLTPTADLGLRRTGADARTDDRSRSGRESARPDSLHVPEEECLAYGIPRLGDAIPGLQAEGLRVADGIDGGVWRSRLFGEVIELPLRRRRERIAKRLYRARPRA